MSVQNTSGSHQDHTDNAQNGPDPGRRSPAIIYAVRTPGDALHSATDRGDLAGVARILQASPYCADTRNGRGRSPLHVAAQMGRNDIVKCLLQYGAEVNAQSHWKYTPLIFAAENHHSDVVVTLIRAQACLEARNKNGNTALHRAVLRQKNQSDTVYALVVLGADVNTRNNLGNTAVYTSIEARMNLNALILCAFGADPTSKCIRGSSASDLVQTREGGETSGRRVNISQVISTWTSENSMRRYQQHLVRFVQEDVAMDLLAILCWASAKGHGIVVDFALQISEDGAKSLVNSAQISRGWNPLHHAAAGGESDIVRILLSHGAAVDSQTFKHTWTPLLLAAEMGRPRTVACLLESGADILAKTHEGRTAFELARDGRHSKTLSILGERSIHLSDHARRQEALDRFNQAKVLLDRGDNVKVVTYRLKERRPRSWSTKTKIASTDPARTSTSDFQESDNSLLKPNAGFDQESNDSRDPSPSNLAEGVQSVISGSFDGMLYSLAPDSSSLSQSSTFDKLISVWDHFDYKQRRDRPVKVAILDTGLDLSHTDFNHSRILRFRNGQPVRAEGEPRQRDRVRAWKDFTVSTTAEPQAELIDLDGHGTQVASLLFRLAPRSDLYIARVCEGNIQRGVLKELDPSSNPFQMPQPDVAAAAVEWAIQQEVDIINMSFGFSSRIRGPLKNALNRAARGHILVFAAMSNDGNNGRYDGAAWPANDPSLTIGIHSCKIKGRHSSDFTPQPVGGLHNFMVEGEQVLTHWPAAKGGGFRLDEGTSFATPVAASMAALILAFVNQHLCKKDREEASKQVDLDDLRELSGMTRTLRHIGTRVSEDGHSYYYIHPALLWKDFNDIGGDKDRARKYAWDSIKAALER